MIELLITSPPDRTKVVVELWKDNVQLGEVSNEDGTLRLEIYTLAEANRLAVELDELEDALQKARATLS